MKLFQHIQNVYFLGIGGIGMSALAQYFVLNNKKVAGYDKTPGQMTEKLSEMGIDIQFEDEIEKIPQDFFNAEETLVVYTPAVPSELKLLQYFLNNGYKVEKRAVILGRITKEIPTLAVAGTHGKTTTSAILAHLLKQSGYHITAFLGGVLENYQSNFIFEGKDACVVEADEYDRSFLQLDPQYAAITAMDPDHLDIYGEAEELEKSFKAFAAKLPTSENLFLKKGLALEGKTVAIEEQADFHLENILVKDGFYHFDLHYKNQVIKDFTFHLPGRHNLMNAGMALAMAIHFGADVQKLKKALVSFEGVDRRFSYRLKTDHLIVIEDYAHHPEEIKAVSQATREMYPNKKILAVFQPHLYTRTRDFMSEFAESLSRFDQVILLPVYPARELPIPGVDSDHLLTLIELKQKKLSSKQELFQSVQKMNPEVILMLGAGDIGNEVKPLIQSLQNEK